MNIQTNLNSSVRWTSAPLAVKAEPTLAEKASKHYSQNPMDAVILGTEAVYTAASALNAAGDYNSLFHGLSGVMAVSSFAVAGVQAYKSRGLKGSEAKTAQLASVGSFLKGLGMMGAATGMGPAGLALYSVGAAASVYAQIS